MKIENIAVELLKPYKLNAKRHPSEQIKGLAESIRRFGFTQPVVVDGKGEIIIGHGRVDGAKLAGLKEIPCVRRNDLTEAEIKALRLIDNRISETGWDGELLNIDLEGLEFDFTPFNIEFDTLRIDQSEGLTDPDQVPEAPKEPKSKLGDIYHLGAHRLMCGSCLEKGDIEKLLNGHKIDFVFTDPPYGVSYADKNSFLNSIDKGNRNQREIVNDHVDEEEIQEFWKKAFSIIKDNLAEINSYYITGPQIQGMMMMMMMMMEAGLPYRHVIIWVKNNHVLGRCDYNYKHEPIFFGWTNRHAFYGKGQMKTSVWEVDKPLKNDLHPTMKPVALVVNALLNSSKTGAICFDGFLGSGTTLLACEQTGRNCYGMEIDPVYCDVIVKRWENFTGKKAQLIS